MWRQHSIPNENTKHWPQSFAFVKISRTYSSHVGVLQRTAKKCTNSYSSHAQPLFYSLNLLFGGVLVAVAIVICFSSLLPLHGLLTGLNARCVHRTLMSALQLFSKLAKLLRTKLTCKFRPAFLTLTESSKTALLVPFLKSLQIFFELTVRSHCCKALMRKAL